MTEWSRVSDWSVFATYVKCSSVQPTEIITLAKSSEVSQDCGIHSKLEAYLCAHPCSGNRKH